MEKLKKILKSFFLSKFMLSIFGSQKLFKIVEFNKNKIQVLIGNLKTTVSRKNNYFKTV